MNSPVAVGRASFPGGCPRLSARIVVNSTEFSFSWHRGNTPITESRFIMTEQMSEESGARVFSLKIQPFRLDDAGVYILKVSNSNGELLEERYFEIDATDLANLLKHKDRKHELSMSQSTCEPGGSESSQECQPSTSERDERITMFREARKLSNFGHLIPAKKVAACSPSTLPATQQVAPQVATVETHAEAHENSEVLSVFECPVCLEYMLPPYLQCHSGHLVCGNCRPKLQCCPTCRGATPNVRNLGLEKIANTVRFPCKFATSGCSLFFHHQEKVEHEESCEYRPYSCPCPGASCKWQGALPDVMDHLKKVHKSITTLQGEDIVFLATDINLPGAVDWVMMQSCFGYNFMLVLEKQDREQGQQMFYAVVQLIGAKKEAELFMYRLELSTMRRRLAWEATPRSIHEGVAHAIQQSDCLAFDTSTAQLFAENGNLGINVTISMAATDSLMLSSSR